MFIEGKINMVKNLSDKYSKEFLYKTIEVWQPYSPTPLSLHDAQEITENMTALFNFLIDNDRNTKGLFLDSDQQRGDPQ
jgi:hypothetical protein